MPLSVLSQRISNKSRMSPHAKSSLFIRFQCPLSFTFPRLCSMSLSDQTSRVSSGTSFFLRTFLLRTVAFVLPQNSSLYRLTDLASTSFASVSNDLGADPTAGGDLGLRLPSLPCCGRRNWPVASQPRCGRGEELQRQQEEEEAPCAEPF